MHFLSVSSHGGGLGGAGGGADGGDSHKPQVFLHLASFAGGYVPLGGGGTSPRMAPPTLLPRRPLARLAEPHGRHVDNWEEWTIGFGATATADEPTNVAG